MRLVMVTCAVDLLDALPEDQTSIGAALNDSAQELGSTVGVAVVGTRTLGPPLAQKESGALTS